MGSIKAFPSCEHHLSSFSSHCCVFNLKAFVLRVRYRQGRNHFFKLGGPIPWSRVLLSFYRKIDRSTLGVVGYIITLCSSKCYVKVGGPSKFWRSPEPPSTSSGCAHEYRYVRLDRHCRSTVNTASACKQLK